jgi:hypothetical protein
MQRSDPRFEMILAQLVSPRCFFQEIKSPPNHIPVPFGTVLYFQLDQAAVVVHPTGKTGRVETKE